LSRRTIEEWRRAVFRSPRISDPVRVYLLFLAEHMRADRKVSVPRGDVAKALGKHERRISERTTAAHAAGFLSTVSPGYRGHVPVYQGTFPNAERETPTSTLSGAETRTLSALKRVRPHSPPLLETDLSLAGYGRNVGIDEKAEDHPARSDLLVCECHGFPDCSSLDRPHNREESA
jgi:hypothetical protein